MRDIDHIVILKLRELDCLVVIRNSRIELNCELGYFSEGKIGLILIPQYCAAKGYVISLKNE
jgi:hypothetical protein